MKRFTFSMSVRRLALVGVIATLLLGTNTPEALGASPSTITKPSPSPSSGPASSGRRQNGSGTQPNASPNPARNSKPTPPPNAAKIGQAPKIAKSLKAKMAAALKDVDPFSLPLQNCQRVIAGTTPTCQFNLWAVDGTVEVERVPGLSTPLPIWGFSLGDAEGTAPGPTLIMTTGQNLHIRLHNGLRDARAGKVSLEIPAANVAPDTVGVARHAQRDYNFAGLKPGTYLYEAGPTPDAPRQIRMGLSGILIVRPIGYTAANTSAYGNQSSQFDAEWTLAVNEFDSDFNCNPFEDHATSCPLPDHNIFTEYRPNVFLVNGRAFNPDDNAWGSRIEVLTDSTLLLHYANLGTHDRGFTVLNHRQLILADDSSGNFANPSTIGQRPANVATKWLTPGQVADSFITVEPQLEEGNRVPIFESGFHLGGADGKTGLGGMLAYLLVHGMNGTATGPVTTVTITGGSTTGFSGTQALTFKGTFSHPATKAEWFLDTLAAPGSGKAFDMANCDGGVTLTALTFECTMSALKLNSISPAPFDGDHVIWVHGLDATGWGVMSGDVYTYNITGPMSSNLSIHSTPTNGNRINDVANGAGLNETYLPTSDVVVLGTATQSLADWVVLKAEYCLDATTCPNGSGTPMYLTPPMTSGTAALPVLAGPDPTGTSCSSPTVDYGAPGNPNLLPAPPGGGSVVALCGFVPSALFFGPKKLADGNHTIYVHAYEAGPNPLSSGRWGSYLLAGQSIDFTIDRQGPKTTGMVLDPNPNNGRAAQQGNLNFLDSLLVTATIDDSTTGGSVVALGEAFVTDTTKNPTNAPALFTDGSGAEMYPQGAQWDSVTKLAWAYIPLAILNSYPEGKVRFWVHGKDIAGNWGGLTYTELTIDRTPPVFIYGGPTGTPAQGTSVGSCGGTGCTIQYKAQDPVSNGINTNIVTGEWFLGQSITRLPGDDIAVSNDPGQGNGMPFIIATPGTTVSGTFTIDRALIAQYLVMIHAASTQLAPGTPLNIVFRVRDAAGNWTKDTYVVGTA